VRVGDISPTSRPTVTTTHARNQGRNAPYPNTLGQAYAPA
jgi:hypothetical protein